MKKKDFRNKCKSGGILNPIEIEKALVELLRQQPDNTITIPESFYYPNEYDPEDKDFVERCLIDYLEGGESITVHRMDEDDSESYIASISLDKNGCICIKVYEYYHCDFRDVSICDLEDSKDAMRFAIEYAKFDKDESIATAGNLSDRQLDLLNEFLAAAQRLNDAGVSLLWDEDDNSLCAANRDVMQDNDFFRLEPDEELPERAMRLSDTATNALDIEVSYMSDDYDLYYYPEN